MLIRGIQHSLIDKSIPAILSESHVDPDDSATAYEEFFADSPILTSEHPDPTLFQESAQKLFGLNDDPKAWKAVMREMIEGLSDREHIVAIWEGLLGPMPEDFSNLSVSKLSEHCRRQLERTTFSDTTLVDFCSAIVGYDAREQSQRALRDLWDFSLAEPCRIASADLFQVYERLRTKSVSAKLKSIEERSRINEDNKASATSEFATPEYIERIIHEQQEFLAQNPTLAAVKRQYVIPPERIPEAVERTMTAVEKVRRFEETRRVDESELQRGEERQRQGYFGRPEGVALDIEHIMIDTLYSMNSEGLPKADALLAVGESNFSLFYEDVPQGSELVKLKFRSEVDMLASFDDHPELRAAYERLPAKKRERLSGLFKRSEFVRSYEWPERFMRAEDTPEYLKGQDRRYQEIQIFDPVTGKTDRQAGTNDEEIERTENILTKENIDRAREYIKGTKREGQHKRVIMAHESTIGALSSERDQAMAAAQSEAKVRAAALGRGSSPEERRMIFDGVREISKDFQRRLQEQYRELEKIYQQIIPEEEWRGIAKHISHRVDENLIKFIYVVNADGGVIVQEEVLRSQVTGRAAHSELAQGRNTYGAGEIAFEKVDDQWVLVEINNGSGHYRPDADNTLPYVKNVMASKGVDVRHAQLVDCILRGRPLRDQAAF